MSYFYFAQFRGKLNKRTGNTSNIKKNNDRDFLKLICVNCGIAAIERIRSSLSAFETLQQVLMLYRRHSITLRSTISYTSVVHHEFCVFIKLKSHDFQFYDEAKIAISSL